MRAVAAAALPATVQLRHVCSLPGHAYVAQKAWRKATLLRCPLHPEGGCGFCRHGTYPRNKPTGMRVARYYCPKAGVTFSLLPDCLASRFPGELQQIEDVAAVVETAPSIEAAADRVRDDVVTLPSAVRWVRRRLVLLRTALLAVVTMHPGVFGDIPRLSEVRTALGTKCVLATLRAHRDVRLALLPRPLGFSPRLVTGRSARRRRQQRMGPDETGPSG